MIDIIFTIDYEIYGNGDGSLRELVHDPAEKLAALFQKRNARFVLFVEAAELQKIEENRADEAVCAVRKQIRNLHGQGFEVGLHLHPQWCNGRYENGKWFLDYGEYNLCLLPEERIRCIIDDSIAYLRDVLHCPGFTPISFRAGNWLLQPTRTVASVLAGAGVKLDSSAFKGGLQRTLRMDYRPALKNGYYWRFQDDINTCDPDGALIEIPTHTVMAPFWSMLTSKRAGLRRKGGGSSARTGQNMKRYLDYLRFRYPLKLDFCRMTISELISVTARVLEEDKNSPGVYRPLVAIGHTKDLFDLATVDSFLSYLNANSVDIATFNCVYSRCAA